MRIPVKKPVYLLEHIADKILFSGWLEQRISYCNEPSLYDADDEGERPSENQQLSNAKRPAKEESTPLASKSSKLAGPREKDRGIYKHASGMDATHAYVDSANGESDEEDEPPKLLISKSLMREEHVSTGSKSSKPTELREKDHKNHKQANRAYAKDADDDSEEDMPPKPLISKLMAQDVKGSKSIEKIHKKHKWPHGTQQPTAGGATLQKGQVTYMKVKQKKGEHRIKGFEDVFSGSSQDDEEQASTQNLIVKHESGNISTKLEDEERAESKSKRRKLVMVEDDEVEGGAIKAFQKKEAMGKSLESSRKEKLLKKGLTEVVHKGSFKGSEGVKKVHFVDKQGSNNDRTDALGFHTKGLKGKSKLEEETIYGNKVPGEPVKKENLYKAPQSRKEMKSVSNEKAGAKAYLSKDSIGMGSGSHTDVGKAVKEMCTNIKTSTVEHQRIVRDKDVAVGDEMSSGVTEGGDTIEGHGAEIKGDDKPNVGWVQCDDCHKWRCIPIELIEHIEKTNCHWSCKENPKKEFADCSIPQEKSNAEINAELNISEVSICEDGNDNVPPTDSKVSDDPQKQYRQTTWTMIKQNIYHHRQRKALSIDEVMVCECMPPKDGSGGCRDDCHNRVVNIECTPQLCPCGDLCSNQQFQKRSYANVKWFRCGRKGFGLQVLEDVPKGAFIIEYVGEVLDMVSYETRQKEYTARGQKHFYFMALNSTEVIDACKKGNLGRFINHSCDPNCVMEKWMVNGEICIGLFAIHDIKKGEEITFDYNLVRVPGVASKKCLCGSADCRGYIGGDHHSVPENDFDEDDPEPIMIEESSEDGLGMEVEQTLNKNMFRNEVNSVGSLSTKRKWMVADSGMKDGAGSKKARTDGVSRNLDSTSSKKPLIELNGVEETLNEMLDEKGGICRRQLTYKEAATQYLKLLMQTVASGDEASRSVRGLSMVLDALLKTVSRAILLGIVERNGLQLLHNLVKQFRKNYKMTPILRKLLKVLCFLAAKNILTRERINAEPVRYGGQSVRDTIFHLCRHGDSEVQRIASYFKEKWLLQSGNVPSKDHKDPSSDKSIENRNKVLPDKLFKNQKNCSSTDQNNSYMENVNYKKDMSSMHNTNRHKDFLFVDNNSRRKDFSYRDNINRHKDFSSNKPFMGHKKFPSTVDTNWNSRPLYQQFQHHDSMNLTTADDDGGGHGQLAQTKNAQLMRKTKGPSRWDQPSQKVQDTSEQGLSPTFQTYNASKLVEGRSQPRSEVPYNSVHIDAVKPRAYQSHEKRFGPAASQVMDPRQLRLPAGRSQPQTEATCEEEQVQGLACSDAGHIHIFHESPQKHSHAASQGTGFQPPVSVSAGCPVADLSAALAATAGGFSVSDSHQPSPRPPQQQPVSLQFPTVGSQQAHFSGVVSGIPVGQPMPGSSTISCMPQNLSVCVGIPITHMQGAHTSGQLNPSSFTPMHGSSPIMHEGQVLRPMLVDSVAKGAGLPTEVACSIPLSQFSQQVDVSVSTSQFSQPVHGGISTLQFPQQVHSAVSSCQLSQQMHGALKSPSHPQSRAIYHSWDAYNVDDARHGQVDSGWGKKSTEDSRPRIPEECDPEPPVPGL